MHFRFYHIILLFVISACGSSDNIPQPEEYKVIYYYVIPSDESEDEITYNKLLNATGNMQNWLKSATGGITFEFSDPSNPVVIYLAREPASYYEDRWWELIPDELKEEGFPVNEPGFLSMLWIHDIRYLQDEDIIGFGQVFCNGTCGTAMVGTRDAIIFGSFRNLYIPLHTLGHALGLNHPFEEDDSSVPPDSKLRESIMATLSQTITVDIIEQGFLTNEKEELYESPFLKSDVTTNQPYLGHVINFPFSENLPEIDFDVVIDGKNVSVTDNSTNAKYYYWLFGDGSSSNDPNPTHSYSTPGIYTIQVSVTSDQFTAETGFEVVNIE